MIVLVVVPLLQTQPIIPFVDGVIPGINLARLPIHGRIWQVHLHNVLAIVEHSVEEPKLFYINERRNDLGAEFHQRVIVAPQILVHSHVQHRLQLQRHGQAAQSHRTEDGPFVHVRGHAQQRNIRHFDLVIRGPADGALRYELVAAVRNIANRSVCIKGRVLVLEELSAKRNE